MNMNKIIAKILKVREFTMAQIADLTDNALNRIPDGFNNNIIWNLTHLICAQQGICYLRAGQQALVPAKYIAPFSTNTKPERTIEEEEIREIKTLFIDTIKQLQSDYDNRIFENYTASPNILKIYGIQLAGIDDALEFILYHEGYHSGYILALKKMISI